MDEAYWLVSSAYVLLNVTYDSTLKFSFLFET